MVQRLIPEYLTLGFVTIIDLRAELGTVVVLTNQDENLIELLDAAREQALADDDPEDEPPSP